MQYLATIGIWHKSVRRQFVNHNRRYVQLPFRLPYRLPFRGATIENMGMQTDKGLSDCFEVN